jgi:hypothetical protein
LDSSLLKVKTPNGAFQKYAKVENELVSQYIQSIPATMEEAQGTLASSIHFRYKVDEHITQHDTQVYENRVWLAKEIGDFHSRANTAYSGVIKAIASMLRPRSEIFVSIHQPNLFAFSGVFKKIVLLQHLKTRMQRLARSHSFPRGVTFTNLFLIVDHDFMEDRWMRTAQLPSVDTADGLLELKMPVKHSDRWKMVCNMPHPNRSVVDEWYKQVRRWLRNSGPGKAENDEQRIIMEANVEKFWDRVVEESYKRCQSYAEFNSFMMTHIVNKIFGYDTLFVPLSRLGQAFKNGYNFLIQNSTIYRDALAESETIFTKYGLKCGVSDNARCHSPLWLHCSTCGSKASSKIIVDEEGRNKLGGICMGCKKQLNLFLTSDGKIPDGLIDHVSPRAIPILALLSRELGVSCYASGIGGSMRYVMDGLTVFSQLDINVPLTLAWSGEDRYFGIGKETALRSLNINNVKGVDDLCDKLRRDLIAYSIRIKPYLELRRQNYERQISNGRLLEQINEIKVEQRKIRALATKAEKVRKAVHVKPCILDYVVNFGLEKTADMWEDNLVENGRLDAPLVML